ncbi:Synaptotagmin-14 [Oryzias melastigma]|uniref:Synaptotagmin-14 n=1 Tax=Oryzias melastigma TaxID=30732 RepID=A0A834FEX6_ORYME|nr:Synaptotagmin-14 [Oryzias melastigma]
MSVIMAGGRNCGVNELFCARRVSPELLGVLSSVAAFMALMALFFLYLSNKLSVESSDNFVRLSGCRSDQRAHGVTLAPRSANNRMSVF